MCGLFISIGYPPDKRAIDVAAHRGPDGEGWRVFESPAGPVALGHRRLAIIDLEERAAEPMQSGDGHRFMVFNGEIYNYIELRRELEAAGVRFRTESDSEVLLEAYGLWGPSALERFIGMFAVAIFDDRDKTLFLARDRFGIKPLVYHASGKGVAFASEIKQLLALETFSRRINLRRLHNFLSNGVTDHLDETTFADAANFRPAAFALLDLKTWRPGGDVPLRDYWTPPRPENPDIPEADAAAEFRALFLDSVRLHMRADVRVGSCLSGGLDSSSIVAAQALAWPKGGERLNAVSAVFPGTAVDESRFIDAVVEKTGVNPIRVTLDPSSVFEDADRIIRAQDEPYGSTSIHAQYHVFRAARAAGVKVMLDGQGADEILGGYHGCFHFHYLRLVREFRLAELLKTLNERKAWHGASRRAQLAPFLGRLPPGLRRLASAPGARAVPPQPDWMGTALLRAHGPREGSVLEEARAMWGLPPVRSLGDYCLALTRATNLPMLLRYEDRNSMAHSIEARVPFLDHRLVEFALRLGDRWKIVGGDTKSVLRRAMDGILPDLVRDRRDKLGFATPEEAWFRGPLRNEVEASVERTLRLFPDLLAREATRAFARQMLDGERPFDFSLWRIAVLGIWGKAYGMTL